MSIHARPTTLLSLSEVMREMHRIATGQEITEDEARAYFRNPKRLAEAVESSGALNNRQKCAAIERLLERGRAVTSDEPGRKGSDGL